MRAYIHLLLLLAFLQIAGNVAADATVTRMQGGAVYQADQFEGADFSVKVNACLSAVERAGGGTCDARNFPGTNTASESITVGDGTHGTTLLLPVGNVIFASGYRMFYRAYSAIIGQGSSAAGGSNAASVITCHATAALGCVQSYNENVQFPYLFNFEITETGSSASTSEALGIGGVGYADVISGSFSKIFASGFDVGIYAGGDGGCTCYNRFDDDGGAGKTYGVQTANNSKYGGDFNSNTWTGGWAWGATGLADNGGVGNRWIGVDIENSPKSGFVLGGSGSIIINPYEEGTGFDYLNGSYNMVISSGPWTPSQSSTCTTCSWVTAASGLTSQAYYPSISKSLVLSYDMIPRSSGYTLYDQSANGYNAKIGYGGSGFWRVWTKTGLWDDGGWSAGPPTFPSRVPSGSASRSVVAWFETTRDSVQEIGGWGTNGPRTKFAIRISSGKLCLDDYDGPCVPGPAVNVADGNWHMAVVTYNGENVVISLDGYTSATTRRSEKTTPSHLVVSGDPDGVGFTGQLGYFGVYSNALSPADITALYADFIATHSISPILPSLAKPAASTGVVAPRSTNTGGAITGLSAATSVTITFANKGFSNAVFCVANSSVASKQPYVSSISTAAVTFAFPSLTGALYYHCDGN